MKFRASGDVSFNTQAEAQALMDYIFSVRADCVTDDAGIPVARKARTHECFHDDVPATPCSNYTSLDFDAV